jgi:hypothetical protein
MKPFGMAVFKVHDGKAETKFHHVIYFLIVLGFQLIGVYLNVSTNMSMTNTKVMLIDKSAHFTEIFNSMIVFLGTLTYFFNRHRMLGIFERFDIIDIEVR